MKERDMPHAPFDPIPPGFDRNTETEDHLRRYGFPVGRWKGRWGAGRIIEPTFRKMDHKQHRSRSKRHLGEETATVWSGAVIYPPEGTTINAVQAVWNVPNGYPPPEAEDGKWYTVSSWVGIDGDGDSADILQA